MSTITSEDATYWAANQASLEAPEKLKLNVLEFSKGVRSNEINENFNLIKYWIEAERLRLGGWGIVEGFEMTKNLSNYTVHVSPGIIINEHGEEIHVKETVLQSNILAEDSYKHIVERNLKVNNNGIVTLQFNMFSLNNERTITYAPPTDMMTNISTEFRVTISNSGVPLKLDLDIQAIMENKILLPHLAGQEVDVEYTYLNDRIDGIFLKADGSEYQYERGIISTSPSNQDVQDYFDNGYYLIGFAYWHVGSEIDVEFFCGDRTLRPVYVDRSNILYLNGKRYKEKTVIYFVEPNPPEENDLWYNVEEEILYIWRRDENGKYGWQIVNDLSRTVVSVHQFSIHENPEDLQTFSFEAYPELSFIPGHHQLTVLIDQVVIMEDQYTEIYPEDGEGFASGSGFKLKYPLERPSVVEVRVTHSVNSNHKRLDLFAHEAFYGASNYTVVGTDLNQVYPVECQFQCFASQIEVYKNGIQLIEGRDFNGVLLNGTVANTLYTNQLCDQFKLVAEPNRNDVISYRILRPVTSYSNLKSIIEQYEEIAQNCLEEATSVSSRLTTLSNNVSTIELDYGDTLRTHTAKISALENGKISTEEKLTASNLDPTICKGIVSGKVTFEKNASSPIIFLSGLTESDYLTVGYQPVNENTILLVEGHDYTISEVTNGINLNLISRWSGDANAKLYITALKIGM